MLPADVVRRGFTINGAITPAAAASVFFLPPSIDDLLARIGAQTFFLQHGLPVTGKTTAAYHALHALKQRGWPCAAVDLSSLNLTSSEAFWTALHAILAITLADCGCTLRPFTEPGGFQAAFLRNHSAPTHAWCSCLIALMFWMRQAWLSRMR